MSKELLCYCPFVCPANKHCFVVKFEEEPKEPITILYKCKITKKDIEIKIGDSVIRPP